MIQRNPVTRAGREAKRLWLKGRIAGIAGDIKDNIRDARGSLDRLKAAGDALSRRWAMRTARDLGRRAEPGILGEVTRSTLSRTPQRELGMARDIIRGRAQRAAAAAARGSAAGRRALEIYDRQLTPTTPKGGRKPRSANNLRPGPRNTQGPPPKPKKPRKPRKPRG